MNIFACFFLVRHNNEHINYMEKYQNSTTVKKIGAGTHYGLIFIHNHLRLEEYKCVIQLNKVIQKQWHRWFASMHSICRQIRFLEFINKKTSKQFVGNFVSSWFIHFMGDENVEQLRENSAWKVQIDFKIHSIVCRRITFMTKCGLVWWAVKGAAREIVIKLIMWRVPMDHINHMQPFNFGANSFMENSTKQSNLTARVDVVVATAQKYQLIFFILFHSHRYFMLFISLTFH